MRRRQKIEIDILDLISILYPGIVTLTIPFIMFHLHLKMLEVIVKNRVVVGINTGHELGFFNFGFFV